MNPIVNKFRREADDEVQLRPCFMSRRSRSCILAWIEVHGRVLLSKKMAFCNYFLDDRATPSELEEYYVSTVKNYFESHFLKEGKWS